MRHHSAFWLFWIVVGLAASAGSADLPEPAWPSASPWSSGMPDMPSWADWLPSAATKPPPAMPSWAQPGSSSGASEQWFPPRLEQQQGAREAPPFGARPTESSQPDLNGTWRGSAGERVQIWRDRARIWRDAQQFCDFIFLIYGDRLIAYSPTSDVVRKYEFTGGNGWFALRDEAGQVMSFRKAR